MREHHRPANIVGIIDIVAFAFSGDFALRVLLVVLLIVIAGCASTDDRPEAMGEAERAGMMERLGSTLSSACGTDNYCLGLASRFGGFLWQYRDSFSVQTRVFRCVGQYAVRSGYRWGVRRFIGERLDQTQATSMVTYLYQCAVPEWARGWFDGEESEPPVPPGEIAPVRPTGAPPAAMVSRPSGTAATPASPRAPAGPFSSSDALDLQNTTAFSKTLQRQNEMQRVP